LEGGRLLAVRALAFFLIFAALQMGWEACRGTAVDRIVIHHGTVRPAAFVVNVLTPTIGAQAVGSALRAPGGGLNVRNGCEGLDALFLLIAAFAVTPLTLRQRWIGLLIGAGVVFTLNQVRLLVLFYALRADTGWFYPLHATVAPLTVVLLVAAYFYAWLRLSDSATARMG
jgi:exosortase family protein XrtM